MEVSNNYTVRPNFKASFTTHNVTQNQARWNRIGKMFQTATKEIPDDKLILGYSKQDVRPFFYFTLNDSENRLDMIGIQDLGDWILSKSNKEISEKFVRLFKSMKIRHDAMQEYRAAHIEVLAGNTQKVRSMRMAEKWYAEQMINQNKDDEEILSFFGANYIYDKTGIISSFRENYANCKNCW